MVLERLHVMNPTRDTGRITPRVKNTLTMPPFMASGRFSITRIA
jgi:hypothetical protein